ncbi:MAG: carbohydrate binding family 9 domain-containing protein [Sphingomonadales bacterium]|nr:carbohydrate binding family 9 domain-containing protein [Sphingomonadales bacterium]
MNRLILLFFFWLATAVAAIAQQTSFNEIKDRLDTGYRAKKTIDPIKIDGLIIEQTWKEAQKTIYFVQNFPTDTLLSKAMQEIRVAYDERFLYVAAKIYKSIKDQPFTTPSLKRDFRGEAFDAFVVSIDPFMDRMNAFSFGINPYGVQREGLVVNGGLVGEDLSLSWDNKWYSEAKIEEDYWATEMAIPLNTIRYRKGTNKWLINFYKLDSYNAERSSWSRIPNQFSPISLAYSKPIVFETPIEKKGLNMSLIPYVSPGSFIKPKPGGTNGFTASSTIMFGGDAKIGIGSSLNLDLTVNPDFSQVEVDNQVTNLDRFEILFPEKRQFYLENADLFANFGMDGLRPFFSRRIGVTRDASTGQNIQNKIDAGFRLSGKINDNLRIGLLEMKSAAIPEINEPAYNYSVLSLQQRVFGRSNLSFIFTNKDGIGIKDFNRVAGLDYNLASRSNVWNGKFFFMKSFDPVKTSDNAVLGTTLFFNKRFFDARQTAYYIGENFNPEVGFLRRAGLYRLAGQVQPKFYPKKGRINRWGPMFDYDLTVFPARGVTDYDVNIIFNLQYKNYATLLLRIRNDYTKLTSDFDPTNSGGEKLKENSSYNYTSFICNFITDQRKKLSARLNSRVGQYFNGTRVNLDAEINYRVQPYGSLSSVFSYNRLRFPQPYASRDLILFGPKVDLTFTRSLFFSALLQYNNQINNINMNVRFQWRFAPASDLFIVYTDNYFADLLRSKGSAVVLKATYWFNL